MSIELLDGEIFKRIPIDCVKDYYISNKGRFSNGKRILKQQTNHRGYKYVHLYQKDKGRNHFVHRLVMYAFVGDMPNDGMVVNHIDEVKDNNCLENLEWVTYSQNILHSITEDERNRLRRMSEKIAISNWKKIRVVKIETEEEFLFDSVTEAANVLGLSKNCLSMVARGERKTHGGYKAYYL